MDAGANAGDSQEPAGDGILVRLVLVGQESVPVLLGNHFMVQHVPGCFFLTVGQFTPPAIVGDTPEERRQQAAQVKQIEVRIVSRLAFTRQSMVQLIAFLTDQLQQHDRNVQREAKDADAD
jgi:hypothetical protein